MRERRHDFLTRSRIMAESTVAMPEIEQTQAITQPETQAVEATRPREHYVTPPVDIYETPESLVVIADLPGIDPAHLEVRVDQNILTLRGQTPYQDRKSTRLNSSH